MNIVIVAAISAIIVFLVKMGLNYKDPSPKEYIQDAVLAFSSCGLALYGYNTYFNQPTGAKVPVVFTEKPNF